MSSKRSANQNRRICDLRVVIADDEPEIRETLQAVFQAKGWEVLTYSDGQAAFDNACTKLPDLAIFDVMMPKLNGWEACRELKKCETTKHIPVIILTARTKEVDELMTAESGADLYLPKPFNPLEVYEQAVKLTGGKA
jgi:DNA-binding response OmpR family regulator